VPMCRGLASRRRRTSCSPSWPTSSPPSAPHVGCVQATILWHDVQPTAWWRCRLPIHGPIRDERACGIWREGQSSSDYSEEKIVV
jgi:hypothetical protein